MKIYLAIDQHFSCGKEILFLSIFNSLINKLVK